MFAGATARTASHAGTVRMEDGDVHVYSRQLHMSILPNSETTTAPSPRRSQTAKQGLSLPKGLPPSTKPTQTYDEMMSLIRDREEKRTHAREKEETERMHRVLDHMNQEEGWSRKVGHFISKREVAANQRKIALCKQWQEKVPLPAGPFILSLRLALSHHARPLPKSRP